MSSQVTQKLVRDIGNLSARSGLYRPLYRIQSPRMCIGIFNDKPAFYGFDIVHTLHHPQNRNLYKKILSYELIDHPSYHIQTDNKLYTKSAKVISEIGPAPFSSVPVEIPIGDIMLINNAKCDYLISQQPKYCQNCTCNYETRPL